MNLIISYYNKNIHNFNFKLVIFSIFTLSFSMYSATISGYIRDNYDSEAIFDQIGGAEVSICANISPSTFAVTERAVNIRR